MDQAWKGIETISFNNIAYTYDCLTGLATKAALQPTATLNLSNVVGSSVNEGAAFAINVATTDLPQGSAIYWQISGVGISSNDFDGLASLSGSTITDASGKASINLSTRPDATTEGDELMRFALFSDSSFTNRLAELSVTVQDTSLTPTATNLTLWGTAGNDVITGGSGQDQIACVPRTGTTASALGRGQIDSLTGRGGADRFLLADQRGTFYNDGSSR